MVVLGGEESRKKGCANCGKFRHRSFLPPPQATTTPMSSDLATSFPTLSTSWARIFTPWSWPTDAQHRNHPIETVALTSTRGKRRHRIRPFIRSPSRVDSLFRCCVSHGFGGRPSCVCLSLDLGLGEQFVRYRCVFVPSHTVEFLPHFTRAD